MVRAHYGGIAAASKVSYCTRGQPGLSRPEGADTRPDNPSQLEPRRSSAGQLSTSFTKVQPSPDILRWHEPKPGKKMEEERRLVYRVLRHWTEIKRGGRIPRRDEINRCVLGKDWANCLLIAVQSPIEFSRFVTVGVNLAVAFCPTDTLAGVLLSRLSRVVSARCGLIFEGGATLSGVDILHRSILLPLSEDGVAIDHVLGAVSYHPLPAEEALTPQVISQTHWF